MLKMIIIPLITAVLTVFLGWISIWVKNKLKRAEQSESERDRMTRVTLEKMLLWHSEHLSDFKITKEFVRSLSEMGSLMAVWAPDDALVEYATFLENYSNKENNSLLPHEVHFGAAILAFRKALGFKNKGNKVTAEHTVRVFKCGWERPL